MYIYFHKKEITQKNTKCIRVKATSSSEACIYGNRLAGCHLPRLQLYWGDASREVLYAPEKIVDFSTLVF